jgi:hypothetical protein
MNETNLDKLIDRYEENLDFLYNDENNEIFKWKAMNTFQKEWFSGQYPDFISRFNAATRDFSVLIDNSHMHPRSGVVKLYEQEPAEVERLFCQVLFGEDGGDVSLRQKHMDEFLDGMEQIRVRHFPKNWSFKQDRHSASTFLAMYAPAENYIYKYSEAETMAVYGEYGFDLGSGANFDLRQYYSMCNEIVQRLKLHSSLLQKHFERLNADCYDDQSLHLLAFDLIYCCHAYGYYNGIPHAAKSELVRKAKETAKQKEADAKLQAEIEEITGKIEDLQFQLPDISDILLLNVEVTMGKYGAGRVIEHQFNSIKVQFAEEIKTFVLDEKYWMRPTFEHDAEVVAAYTQYAKISAQIAALEKQLAHLCQAA